MPNLTFHLRSADAVCATASPAIALDLEIASDQPIQTVLLHSQIQIEAPRRRYTAEEQALLRDLFGEPERWSQTLHPLLWTNLTTTVPGFSGAVCIKLVVPCTFDFNVNATKYFHAIEGGTVPITLLFSGSVFYRGAEDQLQAAPIPWNSEARYDLPATTWKQSIELHHPNTAWLGLRRDVFERLYDFKVRHGLATFDDAVERMIGNTLEVGA